jgi:hypothetical protein
MLNQKIENCEDELTFGLGSDVDNFTRSEITTFKLAISALTQQLNNGWIPVTERLPEEFECRDGYIDPSNYVLTQDKSGYFHVSRYWAHRRSAPINIYPWIDLKYEYEIVAWQPLPESYKGE